MSQDPKRWLMLTAICAVAFFLLGAPEISERPGILREVAAWVQASTGLVGLVALILAARSAYVRRSANK